MLEELIYKLEETSQNILSDSIADYTGKIDLLLGQIMKALPMIITSYSDPKMQDLSEDAMYWPQAVESVLNTVASGDRIALFDELYFEFRANLIEFVNITKERNVSVEG